MKAGITFSLFNNMQHTHLLFFFCCCVFLFFFVLGKHFFLSGFIVFYKMPPDHNQENQPFYPQCCWTLIFKPRSLDLLSKVEQTALESAADWFQDPLADAKIHGCSSPFCNMAVQSALCPCGSTCRILHPSPILPTRNTGGQLQFPRR